MKSDRMLPAVNHTGMGALFARALRSALPELPSATSRMAH